MKVTQETDRLEQRAVLLVAMSTLAVTALGVLFAWLLLRDAAPMERQAAGRARSDAREINAMERTLFTRSRVPAGQAPVPKGPPYSWVDREREIVSIPIERAVDLYLSRQPLTQADPGAQP